jgi:hypothetical protein
MSGNHIFDINQSFTLSTSLLIPPGIKDLLGFIRA